MSLEISDVRELELQMVVSHLMWVLGTEFRSGGREYMLLSTGQFLQPPGEIERY